MFKDYPGAPYPNDGYGQMTVSINAFTAELKCTGTDNSVRSKKVEIAGSVTASRAATDGNRPTLSTTTQLKPPRCNNATPIT